MSVTNSVKENIFINREKSSMNLIRLIKNCYRLIKLSRIRRTILELKPNVVSVGKRAFCKQIDIDGKSYIRKTFIPNQEGMRCYKRELLARQLFGDRLWVAPVVKKGRRWLMFPQYPEETRLDHIACNLDKASRMKIAKEAVHILFEIFMKGYAHRDFHAKNLFWVNEQLILVDFEELETYPPGERPAFPMSFDIIGEGLYDSSFGGNIMCYISDTPSQMALQIVLGIPLEQVLEEIEEEFMKSLQELSETSHDKKPYYSCFAGQVHSFFDFPHISLNKIDAWCESSKRLDLLRVDRNSLEGKSLLQLGSDTGGIIFEAQKFGPRDSIGIEYDDRKVEVTNKVAAYCGLNNVRFIQGEINKLDIFKIGREFDVVFCSTVETQVKHKHRLYKLLSDITKETVYLEDNSATDPFKVKAQLIRNGFKRVELLEFSNDDTNRGKCFPVFQLIAQK
ncbi:MAG: methyltransferase domain-containing protein [Planctomycetota bacterium]|jgi:ubiquinone/menaquinone biosynthesis C-methylase UbiE